MTPRAAAARPRAAHPPPAAGSGAPEPRFGNGEMIDALLDPHPQPRHRHAAGKRHGGDASTRRMRSDGFRTRPLGERLRVGGSREVLTGLPRR